MHQRNTSTARENWREACLHLLTRVDFAQNLEIDRVSSQRKRVAISPDTVPVNHASTMMAELSKDVHTTVPV